MFVCQSNRAAASVEHVCSWILRKAVCIPHISVDSVHMGVYMFVCIKNVRCKRGLFFKK